MTAGKLLLITGTTGSGKTTTCKEFVARQDELWLHFGADQFLGGVMPRKFVDGGPRAHEGRHLLAPVGRQAVHEHGPGGSGRHHGVVDDEALEGPVAGLGLGLEAHGGPDVGVDGVGALGPLVGAVDVGDAGRAQDGSPDPGRSCGVRVGSAGSAAAVTGGRVEVVMPRSLGARSVRPL